MSSLARKLLLLVTKLLRCPGRLMNTACSFLVQRVVDSVRKHELLLLRNSHELLLLLRNSHELLLLRNSHGLRSVRQRRKGCNWCTEMLMRESRTGRD